MRYPKQTLVIRARAEDVDWMRAQNIGNTADCLTALVAHGKATGFKPGTMAPMYYGGRKVVFADEVTG